MSEQRGQISGHAPAGFSWGDLVASLVEEHGSLTAVAWKLIEHASGDDVASIERALRRLRGRGQLDGGVWGQRVLRVFGPPASIEARLRWMGLYHSPFNDLPLSLCLDQLRLWDRPPVSASRARVWISLGFASCALRERRFDDAAQHADQTRSAGGPDAAQLELGLIDGYLASRASGDVTAALERVESLLATATLSPEDAACFRARLVDQRAYQLNRASDHAAALALFSALPDSDVHPFASYRRDAGRAYGLHRLGRTAEALALATRAIDHAGDGGYTRLRAMGLLLVAKINGEADAISRASAIAERLDDAELRERVARARA
ncbi:MAG: hypothetical protein H0T46_12405 [Deltaproteobacteria bacterium]|nr:hypothetical protein [Deltaproteobacteria bacterium]